MPSSQTNPFTYFKDWFDEAHQKVKENPNAVTIASASLDGKPSARTVLLRGFSEEGFMFFTNYNSRKSQELISNPQASMLFYWRGIERQIRIEGSITKASSKASDDYWNSRHPDSQANSAFSKQSSIMTDENEVEVKLNEFKTSLDAKGTPRPENWGGFVLKPEYFEFWSEGPNRWHLRHAFLLNNNKWDLNRLYP